MKRIRKGKGNEKIFNFYILVIFTKVTNCTDVLYQEPKLMKKSWTKSLRAMISLQQGYSKSKLVLTMTRSGKQGSLTRLGVGRPRKQNASRKKRRSHV